MHAPAPDAAPVIADPASVVADTAVLPGPWRTIPPFLTNQKRSIGVRSAGWGAWRFLANLKNPESVVDRLHHNRTLPCMSNL